MTQARGFFETLKVIFESTYGTTPTINPGDMFLLPFNDNSVGSDENMIDPQTVRGNRFQVEPIFGNISVTGSVTIPFDVRNIGVWLKLLLGSPTSVDNLDGTHTHTYIPSTDTPSLSIETGFPDINSFHQYSGVKINSFSSRFAVNEELVANVELLGSAETTSGTSLDASPQEHVFSRFNAKNITIKENNVPIGIVKEITLDINNELADDVYTLSSGAFRASLPETGFVVGGSMMLLFEDQTFYNKAINGSETSIQIEAVNGVNSLVFDIKELKFPRRPPQRNGAGPVFLELPFRSYFQDNPDNTPIEVSLTNDVASYA